MVKEKREKESKIRGNSLGASGFTLGVLGIISFGIIGLILSIIGLLFCFIQQKEKPTKLGKAGLVLNVLGILISIIYLYYEIYVWVAPILAQYLQSLNTSLPTA